MALNVGSRLAHYDVTAFIGEGGMGQVYQGWTLSGQGTVYADLHRRTPPR